MEKNGATTDRESVQKNTSLYKIEWNKTNRKIRKARPSLENGPTPSSYRSFAQFGGKTIIWLLLETTI